MDSVCQVESDPNAAPKCDTADCVIPDCFCSADGTKGLDHLIYFRQTVVRLIDSTTKFRPYTDLSSNDRSLELL